MNIKERKTCKFFGFNSNHEDESILIFHICSTNIFTGSNVDYSNCGELHTGDIPRSVMTKGISTTEGTPYGNFIRGNNDKLMISYEREWSHDYTMSGACGVLFEGEMHFFGGYYYIFDDSDLSRQHFVIETQRNAKLVKMTKKENLNIAIQDASCSIFEMPSKNFPWFQTNVVILCFESFAYFEDGFLKNLMDSKSCYLYDGKMTHISDSNYDHPFGGLTRYKKGLITVGGGFFNRKETSAFVNPMIEIFAMDDNKTFRWTVVENKFKVGVGYHSLVTVEASDIHEEYVLLIGGISQSTSASSEVFKFNGTWSSFGSLKQGRVSHNSIYWNEAVYVIGGTYERDVKTKETILESKTKMEIWDIRDSQDHFRTKDNWPELFCWFKPHLFIVQDSFFPDS